MQTTDNLLEVVEQTQCIVVLIIYLRKLGFEISDVTVSGGGNGGDDVDGNGGDDVCGGEEGDDE